SVQVEPQSRGKAILRDIVETIALFLVVFTLSQLLLGNFMIEQRSAYPHYVPGDRILVDKVFYRLGGLQRGDMIVGKWQGDTTDVFKRIIGLPGEKVVIANNKVMINGNVLNEVYLEPGVFTSLQIQGKSTWQLGANEYFVMGDNRLESGDSRSHGPMLISDIVGRAWVRYWPIGKLSLIK
ncbi:MAG TPA: signal peptidase I, partial [Anaerolineae bacterium]